MAADISLKFSFLQPPAGADSSDLLFDVTVVYADNPLPQTPPVPKLTLRRFEGNSTRGHVAILFPNQPNAQFPNATRVAEGDQGAVGIAPTPGAAKSGAVSPQDPATPVLLNFAPRVKADSLEWHFFVSAQPGGAKKAPPILRFEVQAAPAAAKTFNTPAVGAQQMQKPTLTVPQDVTFKPGIFPRLVVGIDLAVLPQPNPVPASPSSGLVQDISPALTRIFSRLTAPNALDDAFSATQSGGLPSSRTAPAPNQSASTAIQDAERAWANQVAEMLICTPYGGPNALYYLNDDDLIARSIQDAGSPKPAPPPKNPKGPQPATINGRVYPIVFACQHLGTFAVAARGASLLQPNFAGDRLQLLAAGSGCAATWVNTKIGKWIVTTPDGSLPAESTDGGQGNPANLAPNETLETSKVLFQIGPTVAATHPFGSAAVFVYANRPALATADCSITGGVEVCLLRDAKGGFRLEDVPVFEDRTLLVNGVSKKKKVLAKNADGTIKTVRRTARTEWALFKGGTNAGDPLADNTAGAHIAFVLRTDNRTQLYQMLDTGGAKTPNRGANVVLVPPVSGFHGGIFDDPATDRINLGPAPTAHDPLRGVGVIAAVTEAQAPTLIQHAQDLKLARPMGFCRIVLLTRGAPITYDNYMHFKAPGQNFLLYASPALPMYTNTDSFPISRFLWAMRDFTDAQNVEAMCFFYVPQGPLGLAMMAAQRTDRCATIAASAVNFMSASDKAKYFVRQVANVPRILADFSLPVLNSTVEVDGQVKLVATYKTKLLNNRGMSLLHGLEGRYGSASLLPLDQTFLRGGQATNGFPSYFI